MNCKKCGNAITPFDKFCQNCGEPNENFNGGNTDNLNQPVNPEPVQEPVAPTPISQPVAPSPVAPAPVMPAQTMPAQPAKKSNTGFIVIIIIMALIIIGLGTFLGIKLLGGNSSEPTPTQNPTQNVVDTPTNVTNDNVIDVDGYTFVKPSDLTYNEAKGIYINANLAFNLKVVPESYEAALTEKDSLVATVNNYIPGATYSENTYGTRKYMNFSGVVQGIQTDLYITSLDDETVVMGLLMVNSNYTRTQAYTYLNKIFDSAKESSTSTFAKTDLAEQINSYDTIEVPSFE